MPAAVGAGGKVTGALRTVPLKTRSSEEAVTLFDYVELQCREKVSSSCPLVAHRREGLNIRE